MKFFQKPSTPLLLIGIGILLFVFGLIAVSSLTEKTDEELIDSYTQQVPLVQGEIKTLLASPGQILNLQFAGARSVDGAYAGENLVLTLREPDSEIPFLQSEDFPARDWQQETLSENQLTSQIVIPLTINIPANLKVANIIEGKLSGTVSYPVEQDKSLVEERVQINQDFRLQLVSQNELLKQVRQRPIWTAAISLPLAIVFILLGIRTELFGRKPHPQP